MISADQLARILPRAGDARVRAFIDPINATLERYAIDTPARIAAFLANVGVESAQLSRLEEGLNYSPERLYLVFHSHFTDADQAAAYARNPERTANRVYANRMGNGDERSGDGYRYRGRGLIQITGRQGYTGCSIALFGYPTRLLTDPDQLLDPQWAAMSAGWYWDLNRINAFADAGDFDGCCDIVNRGRKTAAEGDANGYADRLAIFNKAKEILA